jgi:hypothetical protein
MAGENGPAAPRCGGHSGGTGGTAIVQAWVSRARDAERHAGPMGGRAISRRGRGGDDQGGNETGGACGVGAQGERDGVVLRVGSAASRLGDARRDWVVDPRAHGRTLVSARHSLRRSYRWGGGAGGGGQGASGAGGGACPPRRHSQGKLGRLRGRGNQAGQPHGCVSCGAESRAIGGAAASCL